MRQRIFPAIAMLLGAACTMAGATLNFNFAESYQGLILQGELVGLAVDSNGNGTNVDPALVYLFTAPPNVGITASSQHPYTFIPQTFEQYHEDPFTHIVSLNVTSTPGVYGFNIQNGQILTSPLDLTLVGANQVNLFFNAGSFVTAGGSAAEYGITADGEMDYFWPTVNSFVSYTPVQPIAGSPEPGTLTLFGLAVVGLVALRPRILALPRRPTCRCGLQNN